MAIDMGNNVLYYSAGAAGVIRNLGWLSAGGTADTFARYVKILLRAGGD
jgi:hypothetical protein